jgi:TetR/AcrR family transcriptional regulator, transcriptional repressor for nem operon
VRSMSTAREAIDVRQNILETGQRIMASKGFSAVGLNEILTSAGVPKGSFYHYFSSKDAFGEALLANYFHEHLAEIEQTLNQPGLTVAERLMSYWAFWQDTQASPECQGKCLAVKLGAEVADLSEAMRLALKSGTAKVIDRLAVAIDAGVAEGSLSIDSDPHTTAGTLYHLWLGASLMAKITRTIEPFVTATATTRQILHLQPP